MACLVETASDESALGAARVGDHAEHGFLLEGAVVRAMKLEELRRLRTSARLESSSDRLSNGQAYLESRALS